ncbi:MAG: hypothetical protein HYU54_06450, partial [Actinobacteria bacterium]|nr:hypothetical protein [Actinomycetota bacterium]
MSEQTEREQAVVALLRQLWLGLSAYRLFPGALERPGFVAAVERIRFAAERALPFGPMEVQVHGEQILLEETPVPSDDSIERLARACFERRVERLVVQAVPDARDLDALYATLSTPLEDIDRAGGADAML